MKQSSLDLAYNLAANVIYNSTINLEDKKIILEKLREEYLKMHGDQEVIETIDFNIKER